MGAFKAVKELLTADIVLALYDPHKETTVAADASSYGLGAVLLQRQDDGQNRPVAFASRAMSETEQPYAQIEKEALAVTWACEKFSDYLIGLTFKIETDQKPLVPLLGNKRLDDMPPRIQHFRMRLMRFTYTVVHVLGKNLITADALSRAPVQQPSGAEEDFTREVEAYVNCVVASYPATDRRLVEIRAQQQEDAVCLKIAAFCIGGWPDKQRLSGPMKQFWMVRDELTMVDEILLKGPRIVIPSALRPEIL